GADRRRERLAWLPPRDDPRVRLGRALTRQALGVSGARALLAGAPGVAGCAHAAQVVQGMIVRVDVIELGRGRPEADDLKPANRVAAQDLDPDLGPIRR